ncbi:hypothetical protein BSKO_02021 [Bryopsis sp. KO-2023]|nr:hypothetical protein BSKO_02021 [Bryopsis sp. KO-2023]
MDPPPPHAIVTGASSGIGLDVAKRLLAEGWRVVAVSRTLATLCDALPAEHLHTTAFPIAHDLSTQTGREACAKESLERLDGELDLLVNNAGSAVLGVPFEELSYADFQTDMERNVNSVFVMTQRCVPALEKRKGAVVNVSSVASQRPILGGAGYSVSKAAVDHLTRCSALELAPKGIRVNAVNPGMVRTNLFEKALGGAEIGDAFMANSSKVYPLGRIGMPSDITEMILMLGSAKSAGWITGQTIILDGGKSLTMNTRSVENRSD